MKKLIIFVLFATLANSGQAMTDTLKNIVYLETGGHKLVLDLYYHKDGEPTPLIISIHGGAWRAGNKEDITIPGKFLEKGYAVAGISYRLSQVAKFPAQIMDCKAAIRWLRYHATEYNLNPDMFIAWGGSAGGHLSALLGTSASVDAWDQIGNYQDVSSEVQMVVDWYGPTDFLRMNDKPGKIDHNAPNSPESQLIGVPITLHPDKVKAANPITYIHSGITTAFLIMHGVEDKLVIPSQSQMLFDALQTSEVYAELHLLAGLGHGGNGWDELTCIVDLFFEKVIQNKDRKQ